MCKKPASGIGVPSNLTIPVTHPCHFKSQTHHRVCCKRRCFPGRFGPVSRQVDLWGATAIPVASPRTNRGSRMKVGIWGPALATEEECISPNICRADDLDLYRYARQKRLWFYLAHNTDFLDTSTQNYCTGL